MNSTLSKILTENSFCWNYIIDNEYTDIFDIIGHKTAVAHLEFTKRNLIDIVRNIEPRTYSIRPQLKAGDYVSGNEFNAIFCTLTKNTGCDIAMKFHICTISIEKRCDSEFIRKYVDRYNKVVEEKITVDDKINYQTLREISAIILLSSSISLKSFC